MDWPELARSVVPALAPALVVGVVVATITVVFGTRYAADVQKAVAKINAESARVVAREKDRRDWRRQRVTPMLNAANKRFGLWLSVINEPSVTRATFDELRATFPFADTSHFGIDDRVFAEAFQGFVDVEAGCSENLRVWLDTSVDERSPTPSLPLSRLVSVVEALNTAAEEYVHRV